MNTNHEDRRLKALDVLDAAAKRRTSSVGRCFVYFIRCGDFIKIGTATSLRVRINALQTSSPLELQAAGVIGLDNDTEAFALERELHRRFSAQRVRGEWFRDCLEITDYIAQHARGAED